MANLAIHRLKKSSSNNISDRQSSSAIDRFGSAKISPDSPAPTADFHQFRIPPALSSALNELSDALGRGTAETLADVQVMI
jgi:hypothetical protein